MIEHINLKLDGFGTDCLRIIKGVKRITRVPNEVIYKQTGKKPLAESSQSASSDTSAMCLSLMTVSPRRFSPFTTLPDRYDPRFKFSQSFTGFCFNLAWRRVVEENG
jgi:hypothetical protein